MSEAPCDEVLPASPSYQLEPSSVGLLDLLPLEILHLILKTLDFPSLFRLLRVSRRAKSIVESLPAFRELMLYAPDILKELSRSYILSFYSAGNLHAILRSEGCASCGEFGPFLTLPTCDRCCLSCVRSNKSLWVIPLDMAKRRYKLTQDAPKNISRKLGITGVFTFMDTAVRWKRRTPRVRPAHRSVPVENATIYHGSDQGSLHDN